MSRKVGNLQLSRDEAPEQADEEQHLLAACLWLWRIWLTSRVCCWCSHVSSNGRNRGIILLGLYLSTPSPFHRSYQELLASADDFQVLVWMRAGNLTASSPLLSHVLFHFPSLELYPEPWYKGTPWILCQSAKESFSPVQLGSVLKRINCRQPIPPQP